MNTLIICNTPYQVFNAVNIIMNKVEGADSHTDMIIEKLFRNAETLGENIRELHICRNVIYAQKKENREYTKLRRMLTLFHMKSVISEYEFSDKTFYRNNYDYLWVGDGNRIGLAVYEFQKNAEVVWYDDGVGTYSEYPTEFNQKKFIRIITKAFKIGTQKYEKRKIYVNNRMASKCKEFEVMQLPELNKKNKVLPVLFDLFNYDISKSCLTDKKYIALGQILNEQQGYKGIGIFELLKKADMDMDQFVLRKHPRDRRKYEGCAIDEGENMWELECIEVINENHVLISCFSTAQINPKLIADKEPYLIFLYKILLASNSPLIYEFNRMVAEVKEWYIDNKKIFVPSDVGELKYVLNIIFNHS